MGNLDGLKVGDQIRACVTEVHSSGDAIVTVAGDLVRVVNRTRDPFVSGQMLDLRVIAVQPLAFQLVTSNRLHLDLSV